MPYVVASALAVPLTTIAHEGAHALAAHVRGFGDVQLHALRVSYHAPSATTADRIVTAGAGPLITTVLVLLGVCWLRRRPTSVAAAALVAAAPLRSMASVVFLLSLPFGHALVIPSDERALGVLLGIPIAIFSIVAVVVLGIALTAFVRVVRASPPAARTGVWLGISMGAAIGWAVELTLVARLLP